MKEWTGLECSLPECCGEQEKMERADSKVVGDTPCDLCGLRESEVKIHFAFLSLLFKFQLKLLPRHNWHNVANFKVGICVIPALTCSK